MKTIVTKFAVVAVLALAVVAGASSADAAIMRDLTIGSQGPDVVELQTALEAQGFLVMPAGVAKGYFGPLTKNAVAKWQAAKGITPAAGYFGPISRSAFVASGSVSGQFPAGCTSAAGYSPITGQKCDASSSNTGGDSTDNTGGLKGGEASLEQFDFSSGDDDDVEEGDSAEIAEIEFDVEDGDVRVNRIDLQLVADSGNDEKDPWDTFESLRLLVDGKEIGEIDLSDEDEYLDEDEGTFRLSNLNHIVREGKTVKIIVEITAQNSVDGSDEDKANWTINVLENGIRATDSEGIEQYIGTDTDTVEFEVVVEGDGEELNVSSSNEDPDTETLMVEDDKKSDWYSVFAFDVEAEESDIELDSVQIKLTTSALANVMIDDLILEIDGEEFDDWKYVGSGATTSATVEFDIDGDFTIDADEEVTAVLMAKFRAANVSGAYSATTTNTIQARIVSGAIEGEGADDVVSTGSATGDTHTLATEGLVVTLVSKDADTTGDAKTIGEFTFVVDVKAFEEDAFVELSATRGTTESNTGFNVVILDSNGATTTGTLTFSVDADEGETSNDRVEVSENDTVRFTVKAFFDPAVGGTYRAVLHSINFNETDADADTQKELSPVSDYRTSATFIE